MNEPEDTVFISYNLLTFSKYMGILEASGWTFVVHPKTKQIATSEAGAMRIAANLIDEE